MEDIRGYLPSITNTVMFILIHSDIITINKLNSDNHKNINIHSCNISNGHSHSRGMSIFSTCK
nr:MAG TPA: hypothetical protein [Caudoviricetes sp.]